MAPPQYKFTYFDFSGMGEPIRFLLYYGGIDFIDNRVSMKDWPKFRPSTPLGQIPLLEVDGRVLHQTWPIARFVARRVGLVGKDEFEDYEIEAAVESVNDLRLSVAKFRHETDPKIKQTIKEYLDKERLPFLLGKLEEWAIANDGYLANQKLSWADLYFAGIIDSLGSFMGRDIIAEYPNLKIVRENVFTIPSIKAWVDRRPADNFP